MANFIPRSLYNMTLVYSAMHLQCKKSGWDWLRLLGSRIWSTSICINSLSSLLLICIYKDVWIFLNIVIQVKYYGCLKLATSGIDLALIAVLCRLSKKTHVHISRYLCKQNALKNHHPLLLVMTGRSFGQSTNAPIHQITKEAKNDDPTNVGISVHYPPHFYLTTYVSIFEIPIMYSNSIFTSICSKVP